ncbi:cytochrome P450 71A1 [Musa acuminata AAA Group]|uniref:cytochrome P450 71A1 n=1 Tax=Musa acuminata AAA Group TaxID=214697 RepID=UPI0031D09AD5
MSFHHFLVSHLDALPLSLLALVALSSIFLLFRARPKKPSHVPSPWRLPLIGNLHQLGSLPHRSLRSLSQKHGPVMLLWFGRVPTVVVSSAAAAQEVMKTHDLAFASRPDSSLSDRLFYGSQDVGFCKYGELWRQVRRVCVLHLLSLRRVHSFRPIREEEVALLVGRIRAASSRVNISEMIVSLTSDIICRVAFGRKHVEEEGGGSGVRALFSELTTVLGSFPLRDFVPLLGWIDRLNGLDARVRKTAIKFDAFIETILEEHERKTHTNHARDDSSTMDFSDILLASEAVDGIALSRDCIKANILDMITGGIDTTYTTIEWAMAELVKHPRKMERAQEEIRKIVGSGGELREEMVEGMEYLRAAIKETLRLHPALPLLVPRESMEDARLQGYLIPKGTRVVINAWAIGRDPVSWEKPEEFWPERFVGNSIDFKGQDFQLIPFGAGRRGCPGVAFAMVTTELALANLLYHFDWQLPDGMAGEEMDMSEASGIAVHKKSSLILVAKPPNL